MNRISSLEKISKKDFKSAGSKAARLSFLKQHSIPVPDGFVIPSTVLKYINQSYIRDSNLKKVLSKKSYKFEIDIQTSLAKLNGKVAVRSSAQAEDSHTSSFAGQYSTFLNVSKSNIMQYILKCCASANTPKVLSYRKAMKVKNNSSSFSVLVQQMINPKVSGVAFSVNPITRENETVIEAFKGLGDAVVSGLVTPQRYIVDNESRYVHSNLSSSKQKNLTYAQIIKIHSIVLKIKSILGNDQDIEWAIDHRNALHILQARPITAISITDTWIKVLSREYGVQYTELSLKCLSPMNKKIPFSFFEQIYVPNDNQEACHIRQDKWQAFQNAVKARYSIQDYKKFEKEFIKAATSYLNISNNIAKLNLKPKSDKFLAELYKIYIAKNTQYGAYIWMQFIINNTFSDYANSVLQAKFGDDKTKVSEYLSLIMPSKKAAVLQLADIASKWKSMNINQKNAAYEEFKWLPCLDIHNKSWTKNEFYSNISGFRKSVPFERPKKLLLSIRQQHVLNAAATLSYLKDAKDDFRRQGVMYAQHLYSEIAFRMGVSLKDISFATQTEILSFLDKKVHLSKKKLKDRQKGFAIFFDKNHKINCVTGRKADSFKAKLGLFEASGNTAISGTCASSGRSRGVVRIIKTVANLNKIKKGDILVAVTTHPDYVMALQKASAIVTNEGGITCHAAIIARELKIPCIVGTGNATTVLKEGEKVIVDATKGIVTNLNKTH